MRIDGWDPSLVPFHFPVKIPVSVTSTCEKMRFHLQLAGFPDLSKRMKNTCLAGGVIPLTFGHYGLVFIPASCKPISSQFINHTSFTHFHHLGGIKIEPSWFIGFTFIPLYPIISYPIIFPLQFSFITPFWKLVFYFQYSHSFILLLILLFFSIYVNENRRVCLCFIATFQKKNETSKPEQLRNCRSQTVPR